MNKLSVFILILSIVFVSAWSVSAQTTAFTYQGRLTSSSIPANGTYNMQFGLFSTPTGGTAIATQTVASVAVANGIFTVVLDFGYCPTCFDGNSRYLQTTVGAITLTPRQLIGSAPYAIRALTVTGPLETLIVNDLQIGGALRLGVSSFPPIACGPATKGAVYYSTAGLYPGLAYCDGSQWLLLHSFEVAYGASQNKVVRKESPRPDAERSSDATESKIRTLEIKIREQQEQLQLQQTLIEKLRVSACRQAPTSEFCKNDD